MMADPFAQYAVADSASDPFAAYAMPQKAAVNPSGVGSWTGGGGHQRKPAAVQAMDWLPAAGATALTMAFPEVGIPARLALAFGGGASGEAGREALMRLLGHSKEGMSADRIAATGAGQTLAEGLGLGLERGLVRPVARNLMQEAIRAPMGIKREALATADRLTGGAAEPDPAQLAKQSILERLPMSSRGPARMEAKVEAARDALHSALDDMASQGKSFTAADALNELAALRSKITRRSDAKQALPALDAQIQDFMDHFGQSGQTFDPHEFNAMKQTWQDAAQGIYTARENGMLTVNDQVKGQLNDALARSARKALEGPGGAGSAVAKANARLAELMPLGDALTNARLTGGQVRLPGLPTVIQGLIPSALRTRGLTSEAALGLSHPAVAEATRQLPRTLAALLGLGAAPSDSIRTGH